MSAAQGRFDGGQVRERIIRTRVNAALADRRGIEPTALTDDGVHPNARGYGIWKQVMAKACTAS